MTIENVMMGIEKERKWDKFVYKYKSLVWTHIQFIFGIQMC